MNIKNRIDNKIDLNDKSRCYVCGSKIKNKSNLSEMVWQIEYKCGCIISGAESYNNAYLQVECPKTNKQ